jgi:hypothetical protein
MSLEYPCGTAQFITNLIETGIPFRWRVVSPHGNLGHPTPERLRDTLSQPHIVLVEQIAR